MFLEHRAHFDLQLGFGGEYASMCDETGVAGTPIKTGRGLGEMILSHFLQDDFGQRKHAYSVVPILSLRALLN